jgi:hypothetical protein
MERLRTHGLGLGLVNVLVVRPLACSHTPVEPSSAPAEVRQQAAAVEEAEAVLDHVVTDRRLLAAIRDLLLPALQSQAPQGVRLLPDPDPRAEDAHLAQAAWAREGLRNVLEVQGPWITLAKSGCARSINPALRLSVRLNARAIRPADGEVLYSIFAEYRGEARVHRVGGQ